MTLPAVLLNSLFLNSVGALGLDDDGRVRLHRSICLPPRGRVVCRSCVDATAIFRPRKRSGTVVGACRAKRGLWLPM